MTYNVFGGTLNPAQQQSTTARSSSLCLELALKSACATDVRAARRNQQRLRLQVCVDATSLRRALVVFIDLASFIPAAYTYTFIPASNANLIEPKPWANPAHVRLQENAV